MHEFYISRPYRHQEAKIKEMHAKNNKYRHTHNYIENVMHAEQQTATTSAEVIGGVVHLRDAWQIRTR